jgi:hypothetical protein
MHRIPYADWVAFYNKELDDMFELVQEYLMNPSIEEDNEKYMVFDFQRMYNAFCEYVYLHSTNSFPPR